MNAREREREDECERERERMNAREGEMRIESLLSTPAVRLSKL